MKIAVMGSGGWGTALALILLENGHGVILRSYREEESTILWEEWGSPILKGASLPDGLTLTSGREYVKNYRVVVLVTPSSAVRTTACTMVSLLELSAVLASVSRGIEEDTSLTLTSVIIQEVGEGHPIVTLSSSSHAEEVGRGALTVMVPASQDKAVTELVQDLSTSGRLRVYAPGDVVDMKLSAALENVIALYAGVCDSMGFGNNTETALMTCGLTEIARLGVTLGDRRETFVGLSGVGNLAVTYTSMYSRNRRCDILIGQDTPATEAVREIDVVVEDHYAVATARALAQGAGAEMSTTEVAYQVLHDGRDTRAAIKELMIRARKHELEDNRV